MGFMLRFMNLPLHSLAQSVRIYMEGCSRSTHCNICSASRHQAPCQVLGDIMVCKLQTVRSPHGGSGLFPSSGNKRLIDFVRKSPERTEVTVTHWCGPGPGGPS